MGVEVRDQCRVCRRRWVWTMEDHKASDRTCGRCVARMASASPCVVQTPELRGAAVSGFAFASVATYATAAAISHDVARVLLWVIVIGWGLVFLRALHCAAYPVELP